MPTKTKTGRPTALQRIERAHNAGVTVPLESIPIPRQLKILLAGKSASDIMKEAAPLCAHYLYNCIVTKKFKPSWPRIDVAKYIIDQVEGKAKIRHELTGAGGAPLSWAALVVLATQAEELERLAPGSPLLPVKASKPQTEEKIITLDTLGVEEEPETVNSVAIESHSTST